MPAAPEFKEIEVERIAPNPLQPRNPADIYWPDGTFTEEMRGLIRSIGENGISQSLLVRRAPTRKDGKESYILIAGQRRLIAAKENNLKTVPCLIRDVSELEAGFLALEENVQRHDMSALSEAEQIERLMLLSAKRKQTLTIAEIGKRLGEGTGWVQNRLDLLKCPEVLRQTVERQHGQGREVMSHALRLRKIPKSDLGNFIELIETGVSLQDLSGAIERYETNKKLLKASSTAPDQQTQSRQSEAAQNGSAPMSRGKRLSGETARHMREQIEIGYNNAEAGLLHLKAWLLSPGALPDGQIEALRHLLNEVAAKNSVK